MRLFSVVVPIQKGDINGDGKMDLAEAVMALQMCVEIAPLQRIHIKADVNDDGQIGLPEAVYTLRNVAMIGTE